MYGVEFYKFKQKREKDSFRYTEPLILITVLSLLEGWVTKYAFSYYACEVSLATWALFFFIGIEL